MTAAITSKRHRLTEDQVQFFKENGYLIGLPPIYSPAEVAELNAGYQELLKYLRPGEDEKEIREWHESSRFLYDICVRPRSSTMWRTFWGRTITFGHRTFLSKPRAIAAWSAGTRTLIIGPFRRTIR